MPCPAVMFYVLRHGQTDWNLEGRHQGQADPPLNATGWEQARSAAAQLSSIPLEAAYSSDLERARDTARVIADALQLPVQVHTGLREMNQGAWEGMLAADIRRDYADAWAKRQHDPLNAQPPGGESVAQVAERVWRAVDEIVARHPRGPLLIVSHGLSLATIVCRANGAPLSAAFEHIPDNCAPRAVEWPGPVEA